ncbi:hypothetical protein Trydic_g23662 [Trypoxylus dichotomus]
MLSLNVPNTVTELCRVVTPNFQERLQDDFQDQAERRQRMYQNHKLGLNDVVVLENGVTIELSNIMVIERAICTLKNFKVNLEMFNISLEAYMKQLSIEAEYKQSCLNTLVPMSRSGQISFDLEDITIDGNIGIYNVEDSFVAKNYDINMKLGRVHTKITCKDESDAGYFESIDTDIDKTLLKYISGQLLNLFLIEDIIFYQLSAPIVEVSASELLNDEPAEVISLSSERISKANEKLDSLLNLVNQALVASNHIVLETPALPVCLNKGNKKIICNTGIGRLENLSFSRVGDISFYENQNIQYIYGYIRLVDFRFKYPSFTINESGNSGCVEVGAFRNKMSIRLSVRKENDAFKIEVDKVQAIKILDVDFKTNNLDTIGSCFEQLEEFVLGTIHGTVFPLLEQMLQKELTYAIANN